ncbi:hypothetical protein HDA40_007034 [Hamadaea flava]|uniref:Septum formation family protein n=1 Tax=Hamadaea flava TaxID=1742688 RepID=A0ABV8M0U5_9ACTN|nr:septum formation family protein [Hamadaea flava]MCP2328527.1 hypothetical protein [Hamadaea flava]
MTGRRLRPAALAATVLVLLGGCGLPAKADVRLADHWSMPPAAQQVELKAGDCHQGAADQVDITIEETVDCSFTHLRETTYVGEFTGDLAKLDHAPRLMGSLEWDVTAQQQVYAECDRRTSAYLGRASWYDLRLRLEVIVPADAAWAAGRRWFRCDLSEMDVDWAVTEPRDGSLKRFAYAPACLDITSDVTTIVDCATKHNAEYVGSFLNPMVTKEPESDADYAPIQARCRSLAAPFLGVAASRVAGLTGTTVWFDYEYKFWAAGRRIVHCSLWFGTAAMTGSARGRQGRNLP